MGESCNTQDFESQESKGNPKFRRDSASPRKDSASRSGIRVDKKLTNSTSRPSGLGESGLCVENPKFGTWSLYKHLNILPRAPYCLLIPGYQTLAAISIVESIIALKSALKLGEGRRILEVHEGAIDLGLGRYF